MTEDADAPLLARLHDHPGALERVLGTLRRRGVAVRGLSVVELGDGLLELVFRLGATRITREQVRTQLRALHDVAEVCDDVAARPALPGEPGGTESPEAESPNTTE